MDQDKSKKRSFFSYFKDSEEEYREQLKTSNNIFRDVTNNYFKTRKDIKEKEKEIGKKR